MNRSSHPWTPPRGLPCSSLLYCRRCRKGRRRPGQPFRAIPRRNYKPPCFLHFSRQSSAFSTPASPGSVPYHPEAGIGQARAAGTEIICCSHGHLLRLSCHVLESRRRRPASSLFWRLQINNSSRLSYAAATKGKLPLSSLESTGLSVSCFCLAGPWLLPTTRV